MNDVLCHTEFGRDLAHRHLLWLPLQHDRGNAIFPANPGNHFRREELATRTGLTTLIEHLGDFRVRVFGGQTTNFLNPFRWISQSVLDFGRQGHGQVLA
ncbi:MAG: hypothetical protein MUE50_14925, partial [Pirellulaceae bacterium]|nr:hypothetical protein [Pirellulaceae bacterium]